MRWIVLALSLGATIVSVLIGAMGIWQLPDGGPAVDGAFTLTAGILLLASALLSLIGGILAFNRRKLLGGIFIIIAALLCFFAHSSTRNYSYVILAAGLLAFFIRRPSAYEYEDDEDFDDEDTEYDSHEEYEDEEEKPRGLQGSRAFGGKRYEDGEPAYGGRRKERASRINLDREEYSLSGESALKHDSPRGKPPLSKPPLGNPPFGEPSRVRLAKVCPACGASVGIDHKFCYTCGTQLEGSRLPSELPPESAASPSDKADILNKAEIFDKLDKLDRPDRYGGKYESAAEEENPENDVSDVPEEPAPHRVFVKAQAEDGNENVFKAPISVNPDDSYQEFSNYTRRRKRKRSSLARRIAGLLVLLLAVSGAAWLLLSSMSPTADPVADLGMNQEPPLSIDTSPVIVVPEPTIWEQQQAQIENPTRGAVTGSSVNIRQSNSTAGQIVTRLSTGAAVELIERREGTPGSMPLPWFHIRIPSNGRDGWIYGQYFQPLDGRAATLPSGYTEALLGSFGASRTELSGQLGQPTRQTPTTAAWAGLTADVRTEGGVTRLQITGPAHVLPNGVAVGMDEDMLYRTAGYPSEYVRSQLRYIETAGRGMSVSLQNGRIQNITVGNI